MTHVEDVSGSTKQDMVASSSTALREGDLQRSFDTAAAQIVGKAEDYEGIRVAETGVDKAHILTMLKDTKDMRAPGSGSPVKDHPESEDDEEAGSRDSDSVSIASDESEDLMRNLTGVSRQKTSKKACAKSAGKNAKDKMAMARASGKVIHPKSSSSAASTKPSSAPSSRPAGSANPKRERVASFPVEATVAGEAAKKLKADSGDLDPKLYLDSNGFGNIRNEIGAIASRVLTESLLLEWISDAGDVSKLMAQYCIEFKPHIGRLPQ